MDHVATGLRLQNPADDSGCMIRRRRPKYDRRLVADPAARQTFRQRVAGIDVSSYLLEPSSHVHFLDKQIEEVAAASFPRTSGAKKKSFISMATFDAIKKKRHILKSFTWMGKAASLASVRAVFYFWAKIPGRCIWSSTRGFIAKRICTGRVLLTLSLQELSSQIKSYLHLERLADLDAKADGISKALSSGDPAQIHKSICHVMPRSHSHNLSLVDANGIPSVTAAGSKRVFRDYLSE
eukprot:3547295-Karenia_brevis.AAC.1